MDARLPRLNPIRVGLLHFRKRVERRVPPGRHEQPHDHRDAERGDESALPSLRAPASVHGREPDEANEAEGREHGVHECRQAVEIGRTRGSAERIRTRRERRGGGPRTRRATSTRAATCRRPVASTKGPRGTRQRAGTRDSRYSSNRSPDTVSRMSRGRSPRSISSATSGGCGMGQLLAFIGREKPRQMVSCVFRASSSARSPSASTV